MHIKTDLFSTHLEQIYSYNPLSKTSLQHILCNQLSIQEASELCRMKPHFQTVQMRMIIHEIYIIILYNYTLNYNTLIR